MKAIVMSGASFNVGKTTLTRALCNLLPGSVRVKIGHHAMKPGGMTVSIKWVQVFPLLRPSTDIHVFL